MKKIAILGSTGSIGNSTLNVIEANPGVFSITLLTAESNVDSIFNQIKKFKPKYVYINDDSSSKELNSRLSSENLKTSLLNEKDYLDTIASNDVAVSYTHLTLPTKA